MEAATWVCGDIFKHDLISPDMLHLIHYELPPVLDGQDTKNAKMRAANGSAHAGEESLAFSPVGSVGSSLPVSVPDLRAASSLAVSRIALALTRSAERATGK